VHHADGSQRVPTYGESNAMRTSLRALGFRDDSMSGGHANRWLSPSGHTFDLVPGGEHVGATGNEWEQLAVARAVEYRLLPDLILTHITAPLFLILKWNAYRDRRADDPRQSADIEDFLGLLASRPSIIDAGCKD
jgi:hypothetical protein